ncbi:MAG: phosphoadenosine phosphosulfate reductase [Scytolyngbya sp. HA4215-MV1]|nr:phosphoadenosine phosphosulfate reductase [Scytolyngbya sp. HA4215-MV1]
MTHSDPLTGQKISLNLDYLNHRFEFVHPRDILAWAIQNFPKELVQISTFNVDDMVITDIFYRHLRHPIPVIFLDTLHHFPQTLELVAQVKKFYHLDLQVCKPLEVDSRKAFAAKHGDALWMKNLAQFHQITKIEPLQRRLDELEIAAWVTGRRRNQSATYSDLPVFEQGTKQRLKINPLANWTRKETWAYVFEYDLLYNPLHDQGYSNIGDEPLTLPIGKGEDERAGCWSGSAVGDEIYS